MIYQEQTITIKLMDPQTQERITQRRSAMVASTDDGAVTGLAYLTEVNDDGEVMYSVTHIPSGRNAGGSRKMMQEDVVRTWIENLCEFADWAGDLPHITNQNAALKYAIIGAWEDA